MAQQHRRWAIEVLMPLNSQAMDIIIKRADLLDSPTMPKPLRQFVAHVCAYIVVMRCWEDGDLSVVRCPVVYPQDLGSYVAREFKRLKKRQISQLQNDSSWLTFDEPITGQAESVELKPTPAQGLAAPHEAATETSGWQDSTSKDAFVSWQRMLHYSKL